MSQSVLSIWVVYDHPSDFPGGFIARLHKNDQPTGQVLTHATLNGLRRLLPHGLVCLHRAPGDDPVIVECWL